MLILPGVSLAVVVLRDLAADHMTDATDRGSGDGDRRDNVLKAPSCQTVDATCQTDVVGQSHRRLVTGDYADAFLTRYPEFKEQNRQQNNQRGLQYTAHRIATVLVGTPSLNRHLLLGWTVWCPASRRTLSQSWLFWKLRQEKAMASEALLNIENATALHSPSTFVHLLLPSILLICKADFEVCAPRQHLLNFFLRTWKHTQCSGVERCLTNVKCSAATFWESFGRSSNAAFDGHF